MALVDVACIVYDTMCAEGELRGVKKNKYMLAAVGTFVRCPPDGRYRLLRGIGVALMRMQWGGLHRWARLRRCDVEMLKGTT